jgi:chromosome segregation ATPase
MIHGVAFSQIKARYDKVVEKLSDNENKHASLFRPLITSLTQLATKLNYENVVKILELLNNIRVSIVEEKEMARIQEETTQRDWETLLNHLTAEKQRLSEKRARLRSLIEATTTLLAQLRESLENNKVQLENLEGALVAQTTWCNE